MSFKYQVTWTDYGNTAKETANQESISEIKAFYVTKFKLQYMQLFKIGLK